MTKDGAPLMKRATCVAAALVAALQLSACGPQPVTNPSVKEAARSAPSAPATDADTSQPTSISAPSGNDPRDAQVVLTVDATAKCDGKVNAPEDSSGGVAPGDDEASHPLMNCTVGSLGFKFKVPSMENSGWYCLQDPQSARVSGDIFVCGLGSTAAAYYLLSAYCLGENGRTWDIDRQEGSHVRVASDTEQFYYDGDAGTWTGHRRLRHGNSVVEVRVPLSADDFTQPSLFYRLATSIDWPSGRTFSCQG